MSRAPSSRSFWEDLYDLLARTRDRIYRHPIRTIVVILIVCFATIPSPPIVGIIAIAGLIASITIALKRKPRE